MKAYDPLKDPNPQRWLELDESERIGLVMRYHRRAGAKVPNLKIHATIQAVVESQVAVGDEIPVRRTLERLQDEGLDRHEALHAVGCVLAQHMYDLATDPPPGDPNGRYFAELKKLTAEAWLRGDYGTQDDLES
jgi:hypothetical protein